MFTFCPRSENRRELASILEDADEKAAVYCYSTQFFRLDQELEEKCLAAKIFNSVSAVK